MFYALAIIMFLMGNPMLAFMFLMWAILFDD